MTSENIGKRNLNTISYIILSLCDLSWLSMISIRCASKLAYISKKYGVLAHFVIIIEWVIIYGIMLPKLL